MQGIFTVASTAPYLHLTMFTFAGTDSLQPHKWVNAKVHLLQGSHASQKSGNTREFDNYVQRPGNTLELKKICGKPGKLFEFKHFIPSIAKPKQNSYATRSEWFTKVGKIDWRSAIWFVVSAGYSTHFKTEYQRTHKEMISCMLVHTFFWFPNIPLLTMCHTRESFSCVYHRMHQQVVIIFSDIF